LCRQRPSVSRKSCARNASAEPNAVGSFIVMSRRLMLSMKMLLTPQILRTLRTRCAFGLP